MKIYLAASSKDIDRAERLIALLRAFNHEITFDWPAHIRANPGGANVGTDEQLEEAAELCLRGALDADLVWVANPPVDKPTAGAWGEMVGVIVDNRANPSFTSEIKVIISEPDGPKQFCIFQHLKGVLRFGSDGQALAHIQELAAS
jgi:hypothetical protein